VIRRFAGRPDCVLVDTRSGHAMNSEYLAVGDYVQDILKR
jgi:hypothetical protein